MIGEGGTGGDAYVIDIHSNSSAQCFVFQGDIAIDEVHHGLERGWGVGESKKHYPWFEQSITRLECGFLFVPFLDVYVVVPAANIDFGVEEGSTEVVYMF